METKKSQPYCLVPWHSLCLGSTGEFGPCCMMPSGWGSAARGDTLESVWGGEKIREFRQDMIDGRLPAGCRECQEKEKRGVRAPRTYFNEFFTEMGLRTDDYDQEGRDSEFYHLDISLSNKCNLKCRFCSAANSSTWIKERDALLEIDPRLAWFIGDNQKVIDLPPEEILPFFSKVANLKQIELKGGEPFMSKGHLPLLKQLIASGIAKDLKILYTTNGTMFSDEAIELFKEFRRVSIAVSVDGTGSVYSYVRGGKYSFERDIVPQLQRLHALTESSNLLMNLHFVVNAYNLLNVADFVRWYVNSGLNSTMSLGLVESPPYLSIKILPREIRDEAARRLAGIDLPVVKDLLKGLETLTPTPEWRRDFFEYTKHVDRLRNVSLVQEIPELAEFYTSLAEETKNAERPVVETEGFWYRR